MSELVVTSHAAERWAERIEPGSTLEQARLRIIELFGDAARLDQRSINGQEIWKTSAPIAGLVAKREKGKIVIVTVLSPDKIGCEEVDAEDEEFDADLLVRRLTSRLRVELVWRHHSGDREATEEELKRFLANQLRELHEKGTGKATIERIVIE